jgi:hypothetical protein
LVTWGILMSRGVRITLIVLGIIVALILIFAITLYIAGGQTVDDPFTSGIDVVNVPYTAPAAVTWRIVGAEAADTALYASAASMAAPGDATPAAAGYTQRIDPRTETIDGVEVYVADVPAGPVYIRVYADIDGPKWSEEFLVEAS